MRLNLSIRSTHHGAYALCGQATLLPLRNGHWAHAELRGEIFPATSGLDGPIQGCRTHKHSGYQWMTRYTLRLFKHDV